MIPVIVLLVPKNVVTTF